MCPVKVLFDATVLAEGLHKTSNRSGIFWASYEIFRALEARGDVELGLYATPSMVDGVNQFMDQEFPGKGYRVLNRTQSNFHGPIREWIESRKEEPRNRVGWRKKFLKVIGMLAKIARILWDKYVGCHRVAEIAERFDVFFSPVYLAPRAVRKYAKVPRFTLLYDTIPVLFPQFSPFTLLGFSWNFDLIKGLREEDYGFAISDCTKRDFLRFSPRLKPDNVSVLSLAASEKFHPVDDHAELRRVREKYHIPDGCRYILSLCTIEPRKNLGLALEAFGRLLEETRSKDLVFVLGGGQWGRFEGKWAATLEKLAPWRDRIIHAGYIDDADLAALYAGAEQFVYPSLYEGFGLPPLEAMQCGTPVVTSNVSSLPEVVGDAAIMIDPTDASAIATAMRNLHEKPELRMNLRRRGLARAAEFTWRRTADQICETIRTVVGLNEI